LSKLRNFGGLGGVEPHQTPPLGPPLGTYVLRSCRQSHVAVRKLWTSLCLIDILSLLFSRQLGREVTL